MWPCGTSQADTGTTTDYTDYTTLLQIDDTVPTSQTQSWLESHSYRHLDTKKNNIQEEIPPSFCISPFKHFTETRTTSVSVTNLGCFINDYICRQINIRIHTFVKPQINRTTDLKSALTFHSNLNSSFNNAQTRHGHTCVVS